MFVPKLIEIKHNKETYLKHLNDICLVEVPIKELTIQTTIFYRISMTVVQADEGIEVEMSQLNARNGKYNFTPIC